MEARGFRAVRGGVLRWLVVTAAAWALVVGATGAATPATARAPSGEGGIHKIKHVVVIMQENRSFDSYFGTFRGAEGIPMQDGVPTVCNPHPGSGMCVAPYHDTQDIDSGGPHTRPAMQAQIDDGKMDGFITAAQDANRECVARRPNCPTGREDEVMGYHDSSQIPNYWSYASHFVLQDHMFQPAASWSLTEHLFMVSEWSAQCSQAGDPASCVNNADLDAHAGTPTEAAQGVNFNFAWTDLTYLMHRYHITWKYYVAEGTQPDCADGQTTCAPVPQRAGTPAIWNPLPFFRTVHDDHQLANIQTLNHFTTDARHGQLPAVSWIVPDQQHSEHPPASISTGQAYVTRLINTIMRSPDWDSTAIFLAWDDAGGLYDHLPPPTIDLNGYGLRVPALVISPYAKTGFIDHQTLSFDAYAKFIEDDFLHGRRLDPQHDGRPDPRPTIRENAGILGDLTQDFDFHHKPRAPVLLPEQPTPPPTSGS